MTQNPAASNWRKPDDEPPENIWILIRINNGQVRIGKRVKGRSWRVSGKHGAIPFSVITHWAEIYQPVKDKHASNKTKQIQETSQVPFEEASTEKDTLLSASTSPTNEARAASN